MTSARVIGGEEQQSRFAYCTRESAGVEVVQLTTAPPILVAAATCEMTGGEVSTVALATTLLCAAASK